MNRQKTAVFSPFPLAPQNPPFQAWSPVTAGPPSPAPPPPAPPFVFHLRSSEKHLCPAQGLPIHIPGLWQH